MSTIRDKSLSIIHQKKWSDQDLKDLNTAARLLETPGLTAQITHKIGGVVETGITRLPEKWREKIAQTSEIALKKALKAAMKTVDDVPHKESSDRLHKTLAAVTGTIGGAFGLAAFAVELPISTTLMLRSITEIARAEGEQLSSLDTQQACVEVFALGGPSPDDDASESGYFATRFALAKAVSEAAQHIAAHGLAEKGAPAIVRLITQVAQRFSVQVSEKVAAQLVPGLGAVGGATINTLFMSHFQQMARGHFIIRRLERIYGTDAVESQYRSIQGLDRGL